MSNTIGRQNLTQAIAKDIGNSPEWLAHLVRTTSYAVPKGLPVGTTTQPLLDEATVTAVNPASTSVIASGISTSTITYTTAEDVVMVRQYKDQWDSLDGDYTPIIENCVKSILKKLGTAVIDAMSDSASIAMYETLDDGATLYNFAYGSDTSEDPLDYQAIAKSKLTSVIGQVGGYAPISWIAAYYKAWGNIMGWSDIIASGITYLNGQLTFKGIPVFNQVAGNAAKWGCADKPCVFVGSNKGILVAINYLSVESDEPVRDLSQGSLTLPVAINYTYGLGDVAVGLGKVLNGNSTP
jgi:hypothetical protein